MKSKITHYAKEIALFLVFMAIITNIISLYKSSDLKKEPLNVVNITLYDDIKYTYVNNKPLLIHFWATWCPTCSIEAANIEMVSKHYEVLTIAVKSDSDEIKDYLAENSLSFKVVNDKNAIYASEFNIAAYPTTFIYDKDKNLVFSEVGYTSTLGLWLRMWWAGF